MVAIYLRRSLLDKDSLSIDMQLNYCKQKLQQNEEYEVFEDNGFSGKSLERPAMKKLLDYLEIQCMLKQMQIYIIILIT